MHGNDERISVEGVRVCLAFVYDAVAAVAVAHRPGPPSGPR